MAINRPFLGVWRLLFFVGFPVVSGSVLGPEAPIIGVFEEPLIPVGSSVPGERLSLESVIRAMHQGRDRVSPLALEHYLDAHPSSPWAGSLWWALSTIYHQEGAHSKELEALQRAWAILQTATGPASQLGDRVAGDLAEVLTRYGKQADLRILLASLNGRSITGSSSTKLIWAKSALDGMTLQEGQNRICGPLALLNLAGADWHAPKVKSWLSGISTLPGGTTLLQNADHGRDLGLELVPVQRIGNASITAPMILHQKENHFVAVQAQDGNRYKVYDPAQGITRWITASVLEGESTGYGLIQKQSITRDWRVLDSVESSQIWGAAWCAPGPNPDDSHGPDAPRKESCDGGKGMPIYTFYLVEAGLGISDMPLVYTAPKGPQLDFHLNYNQRDVDQPQTFTYTNWGPKWTSTCISYLIPGPNIKHYRAGGGQLTFAMIPIPQIPAPTSLRVERLSNSGAIIHLPNGEQQILDSKSVKALKALGKSLPESPNPRLAIRENPNAGNSLAISAGPDGWVGSPITAKPGDWVESRTNEIIRRNYGEGGGFILYKPDGSTELYERSDGSLSPKFFLTKKIDPAGNILSINYDASMRITSIQDALGQSTTFSYGYPGDPARVSQITDPFGRTAKFAYNGQGLLQSITDAEGMTSTFAYGGTGSWAMYGGAASNTFASDFISSMTTPYGTTNFNTYSGYEWLGIEATDPLGFKERVEFRHGAPGVASQELQSPPGVFNNELSHRNAFFWDKRVSAVAPTDYMQARIYHWLNGLGYEEVWPVLESEKKPLDSRIWYLYPDQPAANKQGSSSQPTSILRVLDDGSIQQTLNTSNGLGKITSSKDPIGRKMSYVYSANGIDLMEVRNTSDGHNDLLASYTYNGQHRPLTATDAAGMTTLFTYNAAGQIQTIQNPKNERTTLAYDSNGFLKGVSGAVPGSTTTFTYDTAGRVRTVTGPDAFTLTYDYDKLDRRISTTYPDGTSETTYFDRLDVGATVDRKGQWTFMTYNPLRQLVEVLDPQGRSTRMDWCGCGQLEGLVDPMGRFTNWQRDIEGRVVAKIYPDLKSVKYGYDGIGRLTSRMDAKSQITSYSYFPDGNLQQVAYSGGTVRTPNVSYTYDSVFNRLSTMTDNTGTTNYSYYPVSSTPALGAGKLATASSPFTNGTITYGYDELGRVTSRDIEGSTETRIFDSLGRLSSVTSPIGQFVYAYDGLTNRLKQVAYPNGQTTAFNYYDALGSNRLQSIQNQKSDGTNISNFGYTYDFNGQVQTWTRQADAQTPKVESFTYDAVGQLLGSQLNDGSPTGTGLKSYLYGYDEAGNRLSEQVDGQISVSTFNQLNQLTGQRESPVTAASVLVNSGSSTGKSSVSSQKRVAPKKSLSGKAKVSDSVAQRKVIE